jgi:hypothetical protein
MRRRSANEGRVKVAIVENTEASSMVAFNALAAVLRRLFLGAPPTSAWRAPICDNRPR